MARLLPIGKTITWLPVIDMIDAIDDRSKEAQKSFYTIDFDACLNNTALYKKGNCVEYGKPLNVAEVELSVKWQNAMLHLAIVRLFHLLQLLQLGRAPGHPVFQN